MKICNWYKKLAVHGLKCESGTSSHTMPDYDYQGHLHSSTNVKFFIFKAKHKQSEQTD